MILQTWRKWLSCQPRTSRRTPARRPKRFQPRVDILEERLVLSQRTWTGAALNFDNHWSNGDNWNLVSGVAVAPSPGDELIFPANAFQNSNVNDFVDRNFLSITFQSGGYSVSGNKVLLGNGVSGASPHITANAGTVNFEPDIDLFGNIAGGQFRFIADTGATMNLTGVITGAINESVRKEGAGKVVFDAANQYQGTTTVAEGILSITNDSSLGATTRGTAVSDGAALEMVGGITVGTESLSLVNQGIAFGGTLLSTGANNTWNGAVTLNSSTNPVKVTVAQGTDLTFNGVVSGSGDLTIAGSGRLILTAANNYTGTTFVGLGILNIRNSGALGSAAGETHVFTANGAAGVLELENNITVAEPLQVSGGTLHNVAGDNTWNGTVDNLFKVITNDGTLLAINGTMSGAAGIKKSGDGTLRLTGTNTFSGQVNVEEGVLNIGSSSALGQTTKGTIVSDGATLELQPNLFIDDEPLTLRGQGVNGVGALRGLGGQSGWSGDVFLTATSVVGVDAGSLTLGGAITGNSGAGLTKIGDGTLDLTGLTSNFYSGDTTVNAGTLLLSKGEGAQAIAGNLIVGDGNGGPDADVARWTLQDQVANSATVRVNASGLVDLNGRSEQIGPLVLQGGHVITQGGVLTLGVNGGLTSEAAANPATIEGNLSLGTGQQVTIADSPGVNDDVVILAALSGGSTITAFTKVGAGRLVLSGPSTHDGAIRIHDGIVTIRNGQALSNQGVEMENLGTLVLEFDGSFTTGGSSASIILVGSGLNNTGALRSISGSQTWGGRIFLEGPGTNAIGVDTGAALTLSGFFVDFGGSLKKVGGGTLRLTGFDNTFTDPVTVEAGTLEVNGSGSLAANVLTVNPGATLGGTGTVGPVTLNNATLKPGSTPIGALTANDNVVFNGSSTFQARISSTFRGTVQDQLRLPTSSSLVVLNNANLSLDVNLAPGFTLKARDRLKIIDNAGSDAVIGTFAQGTAVSAGKVDFNIVYNGGDGNDVELVVRRINVGIAPMVTDVGLTPRVTEGGVATLSGRLVDPDAADQLFLDVDWDDGTAETFTPGREPFAFTHRYLDDGPHTVRFSWRDQNGLSNSDTRTLTVTNAAPQVNNLLASTRGVANQSVALSGTLQDPGVGDLHTLTVSWGDKKTEVFRLGADASSFQAKHRYRKPGTYVVTLTAQDDDGGVSTIRKRVVVRRSGTSRRAGRIARTQAKAEALVSNAAVDLIAPRG
jgi:autotransporter-associated beta strand protein